MWQRLFSNPRFTMPRSSYLRPELRDVPPFTPTGTDLEIWAWEENDKIYAIAFQGKSQKPLWNYRFRNREDRLRRIEQTILGRRASLKGKEERATARKAFRHSLKVGDILYSSWGYDQTNIDFYQVVALKGVSSVAIQKIGKRVAREERGMDYVVAAPGTGTGKVVTKRVSEGNSVRLTSYSSAYPWDGKPKYETASGWGHG